jgi:hypothetical protein
MWTATRKKKVLSKQRAETSWSLLVFFFWKVQFFKKKKKINKNLKKFDSLKRKILTVKNESKKFPLFQNLCLCTFWPCQFDNTLFQRNAQYKVSIHIFFLSEFQQKYFLVGDLNCVDFLDDFWNFRKTELMDFQ